MKIYCEINDLKPVTCVCCEKELTDRYYKLYAGNDFNTGNLTGSLCEHCVNYINDILQDLGFDIEESRPCGTDK